MPDLLPHKIAHKMTHKMAHKMAHDVLFLRVSSLRSCGFSSLRSNLFISMLMILVTKFYLNQPHDDFYCSSLCSVLLGGDLTKPYQARRCRVLPHCTKSSASPCGVMSRWSSRQGLSMGIEGFLSMGFTLWIREKSQQDVDVGFKRKWMEMEHSWGY